MNSHSLCIAAATTADYFGDLAKALGDSVKHRPGLSAICLVVLIAATVVILIGEKKLRGFFILAGLAIVMITGLTAAEIYSQTTYYGGGPMDVKTSPDSAPKAPILAANQTQDIKTVLRKASEEVADVLKSPQNFFERTCLRQTSTSACGSFLGCHTTCILQTSFRLAYRLGTGAQDVVFVAENPILRCSEKTGGCSIGRRGTAKIGSDLRWIISVPVSGATDEAQPICVMNIDCLTELRNEAELESALSHLYSWSFMISKILSQSEEPIFRKRVDPSITTSETTDIQVHSLISTIKPKDIAYPSEHFLKSTSELSSVPSLNSFTKDEFNKQVQEHFVSYKPPQ